MNAKEYLSQAYHIDQRINCKMEQIRSLKDLVVKVNSVISDIHWQNYDKQIMEKNIVKLLDLEREISDDVSGLLELKKEIISLIKSLDSEEHKTLLELRYLCFNKWDTIASSMKYGKDTVYKIHQQALRKISKKLGSKIPKNPKIPLEYSK